MFSKTLLSYLQFCPSWWSVVLSMLFSADQIMNLSHLYFSVSPVWSENCETEGFALTCLAPCLALNLSRSHHHRKGFLYWGMLWFVLCFPHLQHIERAFDSIPLFSWTTGNDSTHELCFFHSKKSWLSKTKGSSLTRSWWFEDTPKLRLGEAGAVYVDMNVVVGPSAMLWPQSYPPPPQHMSPLSSVEEGGGEEWNWYGAMYTPAYLSIRDRNGDTDRHRLLSHCLCAVLRVK